MDMLDTGFIRTLVELVINKEGNSIYILLFRHFGYICLAISGDVGGIYALYTSVSYISDL